MTLATEDILHIFMAIGLLLAASHMAGYLSCLFRQSRVIGEIVGGLILGPTLLGAFWPEIHRWLFLDNAPTRTILGGIYQSGLFLLMFCSGLEMRSSFQPGERKTAVINTIVGILIPMAGAILAIQHVDFAPLLGTAQSLPALHMVFGIAIAVTSIPVISRILHDLGFLDTPFGRIVLLCAVLEDIVLYVLLAVALSMVGGSRSEFSGITRFLHLAPGSWPFLLYHTVAALIFLAVSVKVGPHLFRWARTHRFNLLGVSSPVAFQIVFMLLLIGMAIFFGITPMFGAFVAGIISGRSGEDSHDARKNIQTFSFAFFIPVYFALVGLRLDLLRNFDLAFFFLFLLFACAIKIASIFLGSRLSGEKSWGAWNLAVAMNARGGPGIVLASLALDAAIISEGFYVSLVMLAMGTSILAGFWFNLIHRKKWPLR